MEALRSIRSFFQRGFQHEVAVARQIWEGYFIEANSISEAGRAMSATNLSLAAPSSVGILREEEQHAALLLDDILPDDLISDILKKLACRDARSLGFACCACKAFKRVLSTEGSTYIWKAAFFGQSGAVMRNASVCEMEQAVSGFGGYKELTIRRVLADTENASADRVNERSIDEEGFNSGIRISEHEERDHEAPHEELVSDPVFLFYLTSSRVPVAWAMVEPCSPFTLDDDPQVLTMVLSLRARLRMLDCDDVGEAEFMGLSRFERHLRDNGESDLLLECFVKDGRDSRIECLLKSRTCLGKRRVDSARGESKKLFVPMDSEVRVAVYDWNIGRLGMWQVEWGVSFGSGRRLRISFKRGAHGQTSSGGRIFCSSPPGRTLIASMIGIFRKEYGFGTGDDEEERMHWFVEVGLSYLRT
jgi:hypothetical protein